MSNPQLPSYVSMGIGSYWANCIFHRWGHEAISIGKYCSVSQQVSFIAGGNHRTDTVSTYPFGAMFGLNPPGPDDRSYDHSDDRGIRVGNDVWIGYGASIMGNLAIGDGAVIASNATVFTDIPPYAIAVGNPARVTKFRHPERIVEKLLAIRWWDWPRNTILERLDDFYLPVAEFCAKYAEVPCSA